MTKKREIYEKLKSNPKNVRFEKYAEQQNFSALDIEAERAATEFMSEKALRKS